MRREMLGLMPSLLSERGSLASVMGHRNPEVVDRFLDLFDVSINDAEEIFTETRRWVWLCAQAREDRRNGVDVPPLMIDRFLHFIDEGWHNWILHTRAYREFCDQHFGYYVDHNPTPKTLKDVKKRELESGGRVVDDTLLDREAQYSYIYDKLGPDILEHWYKTLSHKYWLLADLRRR